MKRFITLIFITCLCVTAATAASVAKPLVREGVRWVCYEYFYNYTHGADDWRYYSIELRGDTVIAGKTYKKAYRTSDKTIPHGMWCSDDEPVACIREYHGKIMASGLY